MRIALFIFVCLGGGVFGYLGDDMAETSQLCCEEGTEYARNHTFEDCSSSIPPDVPKQFAALCLFAMDQCCKEYFQKKRDCDNGIEIATSIRNCNSTRGSEKICCEECIKGSAEGASSAELCDLRTRGSSSEQLLAADAFRHCCKNSRTSGQAHPERPTISTPATSLDSTKTSLCEEYAPNELCAHHCIPVPGSYKCECNPGYKLMADKRNCMEVIQDRCKPRNPCQHKCVDNGIEVKCSCRRGFKLKIDGRNCEDIDECQLEPPVCLANTQCVNIKGSYKCIPLTNESDTKQVSQKGQCPPGFAWNFNNRACDDVDECNLPHTPCPKYLCQNTIGGYKCDGVSGDPANLPSNDQTVAKEQCPTGFRLGSSGLCEDVDECAIKKDECNPLSQFCINTRGSYHCQNHGSKHCPPGFKIGPKTSMCEDINECEDGQDICRADQVCVNVPGEYDCKSKEELNPRKSAKCPDGMRMKPGTDICEDINECLEGTHLCDQHQHCLNTNGSHECLCKLGFELDAFTGACMDVNECATNQHNCIPGSQRCDNTVGSFLCIRMTSCGTGYILQHTTGTCEDIDECALGTHNCARAGPDYQCENHPGSFRCVRKKQTTTSTTLPPEYYEYYESVEEMDNQTDTGKTDPKFPSNQPGISTLAPTPFESSVETGEKNMMPIAIPVNNLEDEKEDKPGSGAKQIDDIPSQTDPPRRTDDYPKSKYFDQQTQGNHFFPQIPPPDSPTKNYEDEHNQPELQHLGSQQPGLQQQPEHQPGSQQSGSQQPGLQQPRLQQPGLLRPELQQTDLQQGSIDFAKPKAPSPEPDENTYFLTPVEPTPPQVVYVEVGKKTASIDGVKQDDGSVVVDPMQIPKNEWTDVKEKPNVYCQPGFEPDFRGTCIDIDECASNRHKCNVNTEVCRNTMGGYLCECAAGYRRHLNTGLCDFVPTTSTTPMPTTERSTTLKSFFWGYPEYRPIGNTRPFRPRTLCDVGYHYNFQTRACDDIDECTNGQANCADVEICVNTKGGYRCECPPNWKLDEVRHKCVPAKNTGQFPPGYANEPVDSVPRASDLAHGFQTSKFVEPEVKQIEDRGAVIMCPSGYKLGYDNACEDIDECEYSKGICGNLVCTNLPGGYVCSCPAGHRLTMTEDAQQRCEDVDECALGGGMNMPDGSVCSQNADCVNTIGSFQCRCHKGFRSAPVNDKVCVDVDECTENPAGSLCQQQCNNVWGGYRCSCHRGYRLNPADNRTCADIDECTEYKSKVLCVGKCYNEPGSYRCTCPSGYRLSDDKKSCIDIDECETGEATCASGVVGSTIDLCLNTRGSYRCHRIVCPPGYKLEGKHRCTRVEKVCHQSDIDCARQPTTYSFNFITFVSNLYIPESKVDLFTMRGPAWPDADMRFRLHLIEANAPPTVKDKADMNFFELTHTGNQAVLSLVRPLQGPQSIELELSMELYSGQQFGGIAVAKLFIHVSEYEF